MKNIAIINVLLLIEMILRCFELFHLDNISERNAKGIGFFCFLATSWLYGAGRRWGNMG
jgi:hypothetical protein